MTETELKPCPFCGSKKVSLEHHHCNGVKEPVIRCNKCGVGVFCTWFLTTDDSLIVHYNRRKGFKE